MSKKLLLIFIFILFSPLAKAIWVKDYCDVKFRNKSIPYEKLNDDMKVLVQDPRVKFLFDTYPKSANWKICETRHTLFLKSIDVNPGVVCLMAKDTKDIVCQEKK